MRTTTCETCGSLLEKECSLCRELKPVDEFQRNKSGPDGRAVYCAACYDRSYNHHG